MDIVTPVIDLKLKIDKEGLTAQENFFYDTILLEMISINQIRYRKLKENSVKYFNTIFYTC